jgi:hypothetical protein
LQEETQSEASLANPGKVGAAIHAAGEFPELTGINTNE